MVSVAIILTFYTFYFFNYIINCKQVENLLNLNYLS